MKLRFNLGEGADYVEEADTRPESPLSTQVPRLPPMRGRYGQAVVPTRGISGR